MSSAVHIPSGATHIIKCNSCLSIVFFDETLIVYSNTVPPGAERLYMCKGVYCPTCTRFVSYSLNHVDTPFRGSMSLD